MNAKSRILILPFLVAMLAIPLAYASFEVNQTDISADDMRQILENYDKETLKQAASLMILAKKDSVGSAVGKIMDERPYVKMFFGNERVNVIVEDFSNYSIALKDGRLESMGEGTVENPTLEIKTDFNTVMALAQEETTPFEALKNGKIRYAGIGFLNSIKYWLIGQGINSIGSDAAK